jgi:hypothetical protein
VSEYTGSVDSDASSLAFQRRQSKADRSTLTRGFVQCINTVANTVI